MMTQAHFVGLVEHSPDPIILLNADNFTIEWMNDVAQDWLQRSRETCAGLALSHILVDKDDLHAALNTTQKQNQFVRGYDLKIATRNGATIIANYVTYNIGQALALVLSPKLQLDPSSIDDVSAIHPVTSLGRMLAHELKNPLAGISGAAQLLRQEQTNDDTRAMTKMIVDEVDRLSRLVSKIEKFGHTTHQEFSKTNIHAVLRTTQNLFKTQPGLGVQFNENYDPSLPDIAGDADQLAQVFTNLVANAIDAMRQSRRGGEIVFETAYAGGVRKRKKDGKHANVPVQVRVIDNGPGIEPALANRIFEPFITTKANGQGLGLSLVSKIVSAHHGLIEVNSQPGRTEFSLRFPAFKDLKNGAI